VHQRTGNRAAVADDVNELCIIEYFTQKADAGPSRNFDEEAVALRREHGFECGADLSLDPGGHV
jgi:hypothetical protein